MEFQVSTLAVRATQQTTLDEQACFATTMQKQIEESLLLITQNHICRQKNKASFHFSATVLRFPIKSDAEISLCIYSHILQLLKKTSILKQITC